MLWLYCSCQYKLLAGNIRTGAMIAAQPMSLLHQMFELDQKSLFATGCSTNVLWYLLMHILH